MLARVGRLSPACREALDQLSVVPSAINADWLDLNGARRGRGGGGDRRHAARAALPARDRAPGGGGEPARAQAPAAQRERRPGAAGDAEPGPRAADAPRRRGGRRRRDPRVRAARRRSRPPRAGSHRQALAHFETLLPHVDRLEPRTRAEVLDGYAWELYNAHRFREAMRAEPRSRPTGFDALGDAVAVGRVLVRLSRHLFLVGETAEAERCVRRAAELFEADARPRRRAPAPRRDPGDDRPVRRGPGGAGDRAAPRWGGGADPQLPGRRPHRPRAAAGEHRDRHRRTSTARAATRTSPRCSRSPARSTSSRRASTEGLAFTAEHGFGSHAYDLHAHRCVAADPARPLGRGARRAARAARRRRRRRHPVRLPRSVVRAAARPPRRPGGRPAAGRRVGARPRARGC